MEDQFKMCLLDPDIGKTIAATLVVSVVVVLVRNVQRAVVA